MTRTLGGVLDDRGWLIGGVLPQNWEGGSSELLDIELEEKEYVHEIPDLLAQFLETLDEHQSREITPELLAMFNQWIREHEDFRPRHDIANRPDLRSMLNQSLVDREAYLRERLAEFGDGELDYETERIREWHSQQLLRIEASQLDRQRLEDYARLFNEQRIYGT